MNKQASKGVSRYNSLLQNKRFVMVVSLLLAIIVWVMFAVIEGDDHESTVTVPVDFRLGAIAYDMGLQAFWASEETNVNTLTLDVTYRTMRYENVRADDIVAEINAAGVTTVGLAALSFRVEPRVSGRFTVEDFHITGSNPPLREIPLFFDHFGENTFDIDVIVQGDIVVPDDHFAAEPLLLQPRVRVSGPQSIVRQIATVQAILRVEEPLEATRRFDHLELIARNEHGGVLSFLTFEYDDPATGVVAEIPVWQQAQLDTAVAFVGLPGTLQPNGLRYTVTPPRVHAALPAAAVPANGAFIVGDIHARDLSPQHNTFRFSASDLTEVHFFTPDDIDYFEVQVDMQGFDMITLTLPAEQITLADPRFAGVMRDATGITIVGPTDIVSELTAADITAVVVTTDETTTGANQRLALNITVGNDSSWVFGTHSVHITLNNA